jgi:hypothetical protein
MAVDLHRGGRKEFSAEEKKQDRGKFWRRECSAVEKAGERKGNGKKANNQKKQEVPNNPFSQRSGTHGFIPWLKLLRAAESGA